MPFDSDNPFYSDDEMELCDLDDGADEFDEGDYDEDECDPDDFDDSMDGDFDSGMTSAGFGTDEDYGHYGGDDGFYGDE